MHHLFQPEFSIMDFPYFPCYLDYLGTMGAMMELTRKNPESGTCHSPEQLVPSCQARKCSGNRFLFSNPYVVSMVIYPSKFQDIVGQATNCAR